MLIATLLAFRFKLLGLVIVGVPEAPIKFNSFIPKLLSAIEDFLIIYDWVNEIPEILTPLIDGFVLLAYGL